MASPDRDDEAGGHYFAPQPATPSAPATVRLELPEGTFRLNVDRGVFSNGRVDPGTRILLRDGPRPRPDGTLVDLGCGYGPIAVTLALRSPGAEVLAVDVNERALELCRQNAASVGVSLTVGNESDVPAELSVDELWSNPPIRIGKAALHELLARWLARLSENGRAVLVVQRNLGADSLASWLAQEGWHVSRLASRKGYRLLQVTRSAEAFDHRR